MISVVYFNDGGRNIMVGAFLMRSDAEQFIKSQVFELHYKIKDIDDWASWSKIKDAIKTEEGTTV
jgi:hypothetical protein